MSGATASTGGSPPMMTIVGVAVKGGSGSSRAVEWAAENLKADLFILVHVMPTITSVPTPCKLFGYINFTVIENSFYSIK